MNWSKQDTKQNHQTHTSDTLPATTLWYAAKPKPKQSIRSKFSFNLQLGILFKKNTTLRPGQTEWWNGRNGRKSLCRKQTKATKAKLDEMGKCEERQTKNEKKNPARERWNASGLDLDIHNADHTHSWLHPISNRAATHASKSFRVDLFGINCQDS